MGVPFLMPRGHAQADVAPGTNISGMFGSGTNISLLGDIIWSDGAVSPSVPVTIIGNRFTINKTGGRDTNMFDVTGGNRVLNISDVTFTGLRNAPGGFFYITSNNNTLNLDNVVFSDNARTSGTYFYTNTTGGNTPLFLSSATINQRQTVAAGTSGTLANLDPGTVLTVTVDSGTAVIINTGGTYNLLGNITFDRNIASGQGGAIYTTGSAAINLAEGNILFTSNTAGASGGAIYAANTIVVSSTNIGTLAITDNTAASTANNTGGGAFFTNAGNISLLGSYGAITITSNTAGIQGGAFRARNGITLGATASGALAITDNYAGSSGGAFHAVDAAISLAGSYGSIDISRNYSGGNGGAFYAGGNLYGSISLNLSSAGNILIASNTSAGNANGGGAFYANTTITLSATATGTLAITDNTAAENGGAFHTLNNAISITGSYGDVDISRNRAGRRGGAFSAENNNYGNITLDLFSAGNILITSNTAANSTGASGGAFSAGSQARITVSSTATGTLVIADNYSRGAGGALNAGAIRLFGSYSDVLIASNTTAVASGGAFSAATVNTGSIVLNLSSARDIIIRDNSAPGSGSSGEGGAFYTAGNIALNSTAAGTLAITGNYARQNGGAFYAGSGGIAITGSYGAIDISGNTAGHYGGAFSINPNDNSGDITLSSTSSGALSITRNSAYTTGITGAVGGAFSSSRDIIIAGSYGAIDISGNTSNAGGAFYSSINIIVDAITTGTFSITENTAYNFGGGAFYAHSGSIALAGRHGALDISGNTALNGGALYAYTGAITLSGTYANGALVASNTATNGKGGAFYAGRNFSLFLAANNTFTATNNFASTAAGDTTGGFLYVNSGSILFDLAAGAQAVIGAANSLANNTDSIGTGANVSLYKTGDGLLTLWARANVTGTAFVQGGTLDVKGIMASGAAFIGDGALAAITGNGLWSATSVAGSYSNNFIVAGGTLAIADSGSVNVSGTYVQKDSGALKFSVDSALRSSSDAFIVASTATLAGSIDVTGMTRSANFASATGVQSADNQVLIQTTSGPDSISGDFDSKTFGESSIDALPDYLYGDIFKTAANTQVVAGVALSWLGDHAHGSGAFTVETGAFNVDIGLSDTMGLADGSLPYESGWDGKSLTKEGAGLLILSASNSHTGTTTVNAGELRITHTAALGTGRADIAANATLSATFNTAYTFTNTLAGSGLLAIDLGAPASTFDLRTNTATAFTGTVKLHNNTYTLANNDFASATLLSAAGNRTVVGIGTNTLAGLTLDGGRIDFDTNVPADMTSSAFIDVTGTINLITGTIAVRIPQGGATPTAPQTPILQQDEGVFTKLASSATTIGAPGNLSLYDLNTGALVNTTQTVAINQSGTQVATGTYGYGINTKDGAGNNGLYVAYRLTAADILNGQTLTLEQDAAAPAGADDFTARITGAGNLSIAADDSITLNASNAYTGTTTVMSGTLIAGANNALGNTSHLALSADTAFNLNGKTQTIGSGSIAGALTGSGSLGLGGLVEIIGANATLSANIGVTGTTSLRNTQALGNTGTAAISGNAELLIDATGTLAKTLAGSGALSLDGNSAVALTGNNTAYTGTFALDADARLIASTDANLGAANLSGAGTFEKQNASDAPTVATTITLNHANTAFTGTTIITGGTLALADLQGVGSSDILNNAALNLAAPGTFANNVTGGTTTVSSATVTLTGANQTDWHITGAAQVSSTANLGSGATHIDGTLAIAATTAWNYANALTGNGTLHVNLGGTANAFTLAATTGNAFQGTVALASSSFALNGANTAALKNATLQLDTDSHTTVGNGTQQIGNLTLNGGRIDFDTTVPADITSPTFVQTATLALASQTGAIGVNRPGLNLSSTISQLPLLQQDEGNTGAQLVSASSVDGSVSSLVLVDNTTGERITDAKSANINQYGTTVATGTYDYGLSATGDQGTGLYVTYRLTAVDILTGQTLTLEQDAAAPAGADDFTAKITGDGSLSIAADGSITLNASNAYTGTTTVTSGTLIAGANNALGSTSHLALATNAAFDLNGKTQAIGAIDTAANSRLELNGGDLAIANGGTINGALNGSGTLALTGGTLAITSANPAFNAATTIAANAVARITQASGLGSGTIALDGALQVDNTVSGTLQNTLAGAGLLRKTGAGTLTIAGGNPGFNGGVEIEAGRVTATRLDALGAAPVAVAANAAFEQANVAGALQNALTGDGTHYLSNSYLTLASAASYTIKNTTLDSTSALYLAGTGIRFGALKLNGGKLLFATGQPNAAATIETLGGAGGEIVMRVQLDRLVPGITAGGAIADHLIIGDSGTGAYSVFIDTGATQSPFVDADMAVELITVATGNVTFTMSNPGGKIESGLTAFELLPGDRSAYAPDSDKWYLTGRGISHAADAILNTAATIALDWAFALDSLHLRLGDLHSDTAGASLAKRSPGGLASGNFWARGRAYRLTASNDISGLPFKQYGWGLTAGVDRAFQTENGANILGLFADAGSVNRDFDNDGTGTTRSAAVGLYMTMINTTGWFVDAVARLDRYSNEFESRAVNDGHIIRGKYKTKGASLSAETGYRIMRTDGWWVEPALQAAMLWLNGKDYTTDPLPESGQRIDVSIADSEVYQHRARVRFGRQLKDSKWHPYGKFAVVGVHSNGGEIESKNGYPTPLKTNFDGLRVEFGAGTSYRLTDASQLYLDYEYALSSKYQRPWSINLGYRRLW